MMVCVKAVNFLEEGLKQNGDMRCEQAGTVRGGTIDQGRHKRDGGSAGMGRTDLE